MSITLSYIIATRNKLPYLKQGLEKLISHKKPDEEILVADGASTDGTPEYLAELKRQGKIEYYVSEKDFGVAHAYNKLILATRGTLFRYITDDDVFSYPAIQICKTFMLERPDVDLVNTEGGSLNDPDRMFRETDSLQIVRAIDYRERYKKWQEDQTPFPFCDLGIIFRRSSLPVLGLLNVSFYAPDSEYSFRVTAGKVKIAWYTGYSYVNISNPQSVSLTHMREIHNAVERLHLFYLNKKPESLFFRKLKAISNKMQNISFVKTERLTQPYSAVWPKLAKSAENWLDIKNNQKKPEFLWNK